MPLRKDHQTGSSDMKPFTVRRDIEPDGCAFGDMVEPIHNDTPQSGFRPDHRAVENNAFIQRDALFNGNVAADDGPRDLGPDNTTPLAHNGMIDMRANET